MSHLRDASRDVHAFRDAGSAGAASLSMRTFGRTYSVRRADTAQPRVPGTPQRRKPGARRKAVPKRAFPGIPAVAGVATFVAAASGAVTVQAVSSSPQEDTQTGLTVTLEQLQDARNSAADRASRSSRRSGIATVDPGIDATANAAADLARMTAVERAQWEAKQLEELRAIEARANQASVEQTFKRAIEWFLPLRNFRLTAGYGDAGTLWASDHTGQDFAAPYGTPVRAVGSGEIIFAGWDGSYGYKIVLRHDDGTETWYCHLSEFEYTSGYVRAGTVIGYVGSTGNSTGPHLHLEVRPGGGDPINPIPWLRSLGLPI